MKQWERYQHQAAELLRELGFSAEVNASLTEPNGAVHAIDVAAPYRRGRGAALDCRVQVLEQVR